MEKLEEYEILLARLMKSMGMTDYNECRPHESLGNMTPMEYREKKKAD